MRKVAQVYGVDVSKSQLDIVHLSSEEEHFSQISNSATSILNWVSQLPKEGVLVVLEATGCYCSRLRHYLSQYQVPCSVVNPSQSHGFTLAQGIISKTDRQAAKSLALMGQSLELPLYKAKSKEMESRKQILMGITALQKQRQALRNQLHALDHQIVYQPKVVEAFQTTLDTVEQQIEQLEQQLEDLDDDEYARQFKLITSVKGIGAKTARQLLNATSGLQNFQYPRQLSKFVGVVCSSHQSGSSINRKGGITKKGNSELRSCLYMAARSAARYNLACKDLYERLTKKGKPHKKALVAVMNKLLKQAFGVVASGVSFDNEYYLKFIK